MPVFICKPQESLQRPTSYAFSQALLCILNKMVTAINSPWVPLFHLYTSHFSSNSFKQLLRVSYIYSIPVCLAAKCGALINLMAVFNSGLIFPPDSLLLLSLNTL